jgi:hypothetical protein
VNNFPAGLNNSLQFSSKPDPRKQQPKTTTAGIVEPKQNELYKPKNSLPEVSFTAFLHNAIGSSTIVCMLAQWLHNETATLHNTLQLAKSFCSSTTTCKPA